VGTVDGRPVVIAADDAGLLLTAVTLPAAWRLRRSVAALSPLLHGLRHVGVPLRLDLAGLTVVNVLPAPSPLVRLLAPGFARLP